MRVMYLKKVQKMVKVFLINYKLFKSSFTKENKATPNRGKKTTEATIKRNKEPIQEN